MTFSYLVDVKRRINKPRKHSSPRAIHNIYQSIDQDQSPQNMSVMNTLRAKFISMNTSL